jgi:threonine/homoserine efflux transporter RhtA
VLASLFGIILWNEVLPLDSWLAIALIISSGVMSVISNNQNNEKSA